MVAKTPLVTSNEKIFRDMVRHQTYLMRYAGSQRNEAIAALTASEKALQALIIAYSDRSQGLPPASKEMKTLLAELTKDIEGVRGLAWQKIREEDLKQAEEFAKLEQAADLRIIQGAFPIDLGLQALSTQHLSAIALSTPFEGRTLKEWLLRNEDLDVARIVQNAKIGIIRGETPAQVARRVIGTQNLSYKDGVARKAFKDMESVYLTVTNGINNQVKQELYAANDDIIDTELYVATLDIRTTLECAGYDGKTFPRGTGPIPPLHFRCRSLRIAYISPENLNRRGFDSSYDKLLLSDFAKQNGLGQVTSVKDLPRGYKTAYTNWSRGRIREMVGQVPAGRNFNEWLKTQTNEFQDEYMGKGKAEIFRSGKLTLDKFVTHNGYELTIKQLTDLAA